MRGYYSIGATWLTLLAAITGAPATGQVVTKVPNKLGLDIESVALDTAAATAKIVARNTSGRPITAYVVALSPAYSDGEELRGERVIDFFVSLDLARIIPAGPGTDPNNLDAIAAGLTRESTFNYNRPQAAEARLVSIRVEATAVIFEDESTAGDSGWIRKSFDRRDDESVEVLHWCADVKRFADGPLPKKVVDGILAAHRAPEQAPGQSVAEGQRVALMGTLQWGLKWRDDGTATLDKTIMDIFDARCAAAREHLGRNGQQ
jgi:hypothetical protein